MRQVINIGIGTFGVNFTSDFYQQLQKQHNINYESIKDISLNVQSKNNKDQVKGYVDSYFYLSQKQVYVPRAILADLGPQSLQYGSQYRSFDYFASENKLFTKQTAASNYNRGNWTEGRQIFNKMRDQIVRKQVQKCDCFEGFIIHSGIGGGTGSGLANRILQNLQVSYPKKIACSSVLFPSPNISNLVVQPYNCILGIPTLYQHSDFIITYDNQQLYQICQNIQQIEQPSYKEINKIIAKAFSHLTWSQRFSTCLNGSLTQIAQNCVPYPRANFLNFALDDYVFDYTEKMSQKKTSSDYKKMIQNVSLKSHNLMSQIRDNNQQSTYIASMFNFIGYESPLQIRQAINQVKLSQGYNHKFKYTKIGFEVPQIYSLKQKTRLQKISNTSAIISRLEQIRQKYDQMYYRRCFVHYFVGQGGQSGQFSYQRQDVQSLIRDYKTIMSSEQENDLDLME